MCAATSPGAVLFQVYMAIRSCALTWETSIDPFCFRDKKSSQINTIIYLFIYFFDLVV